MLETLITAGGLSSLILEGIKALLRKFSPGLELPAKFYLVALPVLNVLVLPLLALLEVEGYAFPTDWVDFVREAVRVAISTLISLGAYTTAISPLKDHAERNEA